MSRLGPADRLPDPDAQLIMATLLASPRRDEPGVLESAARAYKAVRSHRKRCGCTGPGTCPGRRHLQDAATICDAVLRVPGTPLRCQLDTGHDGKHRQGCTHWGGAG